VCGVRQDIEGLAKVSMVEVPVSWIGIAEEVKMMGSFDNWSRGVDLSPEDYTFSGEQTVRIALFRHQRGSMHTCRTFPPAFSHASELALLHNALDELCADPCLRAIRAGCACSSPRRWSCCLGSTKSSSS
jgi:hypothetical protein